MEHTKIWGLDSLLLELAIVALVCGGLFFYVGVLNPAKENESKWRQWWTYADIFAVVLTIIGVVKIMSPLISAAQIQENANKRNIAIGKRENILYALSRVQDEFCPVAGVKVESLATCGSIRSMQRALTMPRADFVTAKRLLDEDLPKICSGEQCGAPFREIRRQLVEFRTYYLANRSAIDEAQSTTEDDVIYTMLFIAFYMLVGSFRLGRSGAEFQRNRLAVKEAEEKSKRPKSEKGLEDVYARLGRIEEAFAALKSDSDTFRHRHAGLTAVGSAAARRGAWRVDLSHSSGTARDLADRKTIRAALSARLAGLRTGFGIEKLPIEGRWQGSDPAAASIYGVLTIKRSTMSWGGHGRLRGRCFGKFTLEKEEAGAANGKYKTYLLDVRVSGRGDARERLRLSFPEGNPDHMEMTECRQGESVRQMHFKRRQ